MSFQQTYHGLFLKLEQIASRGGYDYVVHVDAGIENGKRYGIYYQRLYGFLANIRSTAER